VQPLSMSADGFTHTFSMFESGGNRHKPVSQSQNFDFRPSHIIEILMLHFFSDGVELLTKRKWTCQVWPTKAEQLCLSKKTRWLS
jgi:hypothetical protein